MRLHPDREGRATRPQGGGAEHLHRSRKPTGEAYAGEGNGRAWAATARAVSAIQRRSRAPSASAAASSSPTETRGESDVGPQQLA